MKESNNESYNNQEVNIGNLKIFIKNCLSGNISLKVAFWGIWFAGSLLLLSMLSIFFGLISTIFKNAGEINYWYSENTSYFLLVYFLFSGFVVWRCKIYKKIYWLYVARVFTLWVVINSAYKIYSNI